MPHGSQDRCLQVLPRSAGLSSRRRACWAPVYPGPLAPRSMAGHLLPAPQAVAARCVALWPAQPTAVNLAIPPKPCYHVPIGQTEQGVALLLKPKHNLGACQRPTITCYQPVLRNDRRRGVRRNTGTGQTEDLWPDNWLNGGGNRGCGTSGVCPRGSGGGYPPSERAKLTVTDLGGGRLRRARSLGRTALKSTPWELAHGAIWQISFATGPSSPLYAVAFTLVWLLVTTNVISLLASPARHTLYDRLAGTLVVHSA